jgi:hypothetical protein
MVRPPFASSSLRLLLLLCLGAAGCQLVSGLSSLEVGDAGPPLPSSGAGGMTSSSGTTTSTTGAPTSSTSGAGGQCAAGVPPTGCTPGPDGCPGTCSSDPPTCNVSCGAGDDSGGCMSPPPMGSDSGVDAIACGKGSGYDCAFTCAGTECATKTVLCPMDGELCTVTCTGSGACSNTTITCYGPCTINCMGTACDNTTMVQCGTGACIGMCSGSPPPHLIQAGTCLPDTTGCPAM